MRVRRQTALAIAIAATVYLAVTATITVIPGIRLPPPISMSTSPVPVHVFALIAAALALQVGVTAAWVGRATLKRRYVAIVAVVEVVLGLGLFLSAAGFRGGRVPPPPGSEPIYLMPSWSLWGLLCLTLVGLLMISAVLLHGSSPRHPAQRAEQVPAA